MACKRTPSTPTNVLKLELLRAAKSLERAAAELEDAGLNRQHHLGHVGTAICGIRNALAKAQAVLDVLVEEDMTASLKEPDL